MSIEYRLSWEMVGQSSLRLFCNADPVFFKNVTQTVPNSQIPDEHWHPVEKITNDPWQQYDTLRRWADEDREFVRNVRLQQREAPARNEGWRDLRQSDDEERSDG